MLLLPGMLLDYGISLERGGVRPGGISRMSLQHFISSEKIIDETGKQTLSILDLHRLGSLLHIRSLMRGNMIRLLLLIRLRRGCSLGTSSL